LKILAVTSTYPRHPGDRVAPFVGSIVQGVAALGHEVHVLVPEYSGWQWPEHDGRVTFHRYRYSPVRSWTPWGFSESLAGGSTIRKPLYLLAPIVAASAVRAARKILSGGGFDLVHAHWVVPNGPIARLAAGPTPLVVSMHGSDIAVSERSRVFGRVARWTFERASAVTAPSRDLLSRARDLGAHEPLELVPYGADEVAVSPEAVAALRSRLGIAVDDVLVAGIGRLIPVKGFDYLVRALAEASRQDPRLRLVLVGDGSERTTLAERAADLGVADRVRLVGAVPHDDVPEYLAAADVVAVPSIRFQGLVDGLPNVALEAMAAGKPLVATRVGGLPDLVHDGGNGLLVEEKSAAELASALLGLAGDADIRARLGTAAREEIRAERSWATVARRFIEIYERAAAR
jgi:phosphatidyl-myo-inositol dimannoside synthase